MPATARQTKDSYIHPPSPAVAINVMADHSLKNQVHILQAQLNAATSRIADPEAMIGHRQEAHPGAELTRALLISAREIITGSQFNQLNHFLSSVRKLKPLNDTTLQESTSNLLRDFYIMKPALSLDQKRS